MKKFEIKDKTFKKIIMYIAITAVCVIALVPLAFAYEPVSYLNLSFDRDSVNAFDSFLMNDYSKTLDYAGSAMEAICLLTPSVLFACPVSEYLEIGVEYLEVLAIAYGTKELCKQCVYRPRPYMYFENAPEDKISEGDWDDSFISGHTTMSFAAASYTTYMFCKYFDDSKWKIPVIAASYTFAATTAALRLASGNHFLTDVLAGAAIGSAIGFAIPLLNSLWDLPAFSDKADIGILPMGLQIALKI
ncbi:MAG: phosphatase PAP2 family protein [Treponemataceae bacterium]|nr:phosphatase PAP2 family protein [Treponemataceae bacterium]